LNVLFSSPVLLLQNVQLCLHRCIFLSLDVRHQPTKKKKQIQCKRTAIFFLFKVEFANLFSFFSAFLRVKTTREGKCWHARKKTSIASSKKKKSQKRNMRNSLNVAFVIFVSESRGDPFFHRRFFFRGGVFFLRFCGVVFSALRCFFF
jgi:hypothetical protein